MARKIYALLTLIWALWSLLLVYLYFFVYYTATLTVNANVPGYRVELYSPGTAQRWTHECPEEVCVIAGVSPFEYNISITKPDYESKVIPAKISARGKESLVVELEKKVFLESVIQDVTEETNKEKIKRLREENLYYARFQVNDGMLLTFKEIEGELLVQYRTGESIRDIHTFPLIEKLDIHVDTISQTEQIFIHVWDEKHILDLQNFSLTRIPFGLPVSYIKKGSSDKKYLVVTEKWTFVYDISNDSSQFQYLFKDFLYSWDDIIWVIYDDEEQKKSNFNISEPGNLIIKYSPEYKTRKIVEATNLPIDRLEWQWEKIIFFAWENKYELKNFD